MVVVSLSRSNAENHKNSPVLNLRAFLHRKADKGIMTMVTLPGDPITTTHLTLPMHPHQPFQTLQDLNALIPMLTTTRKHPLSSDAILHDCPTMITTTAAASNAVDDEQLHANSSLSLLDDTSPDSFPLPQEWTQFYNEFVQSPTYQLSHPTTKPFDCNVVNDDDIKRPNLATNDRDTTPALLATLNDLSTELRNLLHVSSTSSALTINNTATSPPIITDNDDNDTSTAECNTTNCANNKPLNNDQDNDDKDIDNSDDGTNEKSECADDECYNAASGNANCNNNSQTTDDQTPPILCNNKPETTA